VKRIEARLQMLRSDEERQRANVTALGAADKASRDRFVHDLNTTEDKIAAAQKDLETAGAAQQAAQDDLDAKIAAIQMDEKI
jgi:phage shock protein A